MGTILFLKAAARAALVSELSVRPDSAKILFFTGVRYCRADDYHGALLADLEPNEPSRPSARKRRRRA